MDADTATDGQNDGTVTLAFVLDALEAFADPRAVFADARRWSRHVGVVGDDPEVVTAFVERHDLRQDYEHGTLEPYAVLSKLKWEADTDRYVLVGASKADEELAEYTGWEYVPVGEAQEAADWLLAGDAGLLERARIYLSRVAHRAARPG